MSSSIERLLKNSFFQTANGIATTGLNFILMFAYAKWLGPETLGRLVTSQAQVLAGIAIVDLGLTSGMITALHRTPIGERVSMLKRVIAIRFAGACLVMLAVVLMARSGASGADTFWQDLAYTPYLFGYALQYTLTSALVFSGRLGRSVVANLIGTLVSVSVALVLCRSGASVSMLLFSQSWGGFVAALVQWPALAQELKREGGGFSPSVSAAPVGAQNTSNLLSLFLEVWPSALVFAVMAFSARIDQIVAARTMGYAASGQYALAVRLVAIPVLVASSIQFALFSDLQKMAIEAPDRLALYASTSSRWFFRHGGWISTLILMLGGGAVIMLLPKFRPAFSLLPFFIPGVWAQFIYNSLNGCLFGHRLYRGIAVVHGASLVVFAIALAIFPKVFGLSGVALAFDSFTISLMALSLLVLKNARVLPPRFAIWSKYSAEESAWLAKVYASARSRLLRTPA